MPIYRDYEIRINLNELVEQRIPVCSALHPDHCLTELQEDQIAHSLRQELDLTSIYDQVDHKIKEFCDAANISFPSDEWE
tara:strand:+ start:1825 stop:2064 length:240 start_codon:yes stop_codon:yes gene_type:complete